MPSDFRVGLLFNRFSWLQSLDPPQYVFWYHDGKLINYDRVSRISIKTDPGECNELIIIADAELLKPCCFHHVD